VLVDGFEGTLGDSVLLKAAWGVFAKDRSLLLEKESPISEQINGSSYTTLVAAMSGALGRLRRDISGGIMSALPQEPTKIIFQRRESPDEKKQVQISTPILVRRTEPDVAACRSDIGHVYNRSSGGCANRGDCSLGYKQLSFRSCALIGSSHLNST
jgi:hypothetical protein